MKSIQRNARLAGVLYLIITIAAIVAHMYVPLDPHCAWRRDSNS